MDILLGKLGKSILFDKNKWGLIGGDDAPYKLFVHLAKNYPKHNFYMLGRSDLTRARVKENLPSNLIDLWDDYSSKTKLYPHEWIMEKTKNMKFDVGIIFAGPLGSVNIPGVNVLLKDPSTKSKVLQMFEKYAAPIIHYLNVKKPPFFIINEDPRYAPMMCRDLIHEESFHLTQYNGMLKQKKIVSYEDPGNVVLKMTEFRYSGVETIHMIDEEKVDWRNINKPKRMMLILNEGGKGGVGGRGPTVEEWILKHDPSVRVYGKWQEQWLEKYPGNFLPTKMSDLKSDMYETRYTFIIPVQKGWVTAKYWNSIEYGMIPFFHPSYDTQHNLRVPDILRPKTPAEMWATIEMLDNDPIKTKKLKQYLWLQLKDEYFSGKFIRDLISNSIKEITGKGLE